MTINNYKYPNYFWIQAFLQVLALMLFNLYIIIIIVFKLIILSFIFSTH